MNNTLPANDERQHSVKRKRVKTIPAHLFPTPKAGVAWYGREQWERLRTIADDPENFHDTYEEWLANAQARTRDLKQKGVSVQRVDVDIDELRAWCEEQQCKLDGQARANFVVYFLEKPA